MRSPVGSRRGAGHSPRVRPSGAMSARGWRRENTRRRPPSSSTPSTLIARDGGASRAHARAPARPSSSALVRSTPSASSRGSSSAARSTVTTPDALSSAPGDRAPTVVAITGIDAATPKMVRGVHSRRDVRATELRDREQRRHREQHQARDDARGAHTDRHRLALRVEMRHEPECGRAPRRCEIHASRASEWRVEHAPPAEPEREPAQERRAEREHQQRGRVRDRVLPPCPATTNSTAAATPASGVPHRPGNAEYSNGCSLVVKPASRSTPAQ